MKRHNKLLLENKAWAQSKLALNPNFFEESSEDQRPDYLWIGCSDSRVPPSEITGTDPGEIFVHRNIANLVVHTDMNLLGVVQYAVEYLKVKHIIICGHYNCGGVKAAMSNDSFGMLNHWIRNIKETLQAHHLEFKSIPLASDQVNRLVELNVMAQVRNLKNNFIIQSAWKHHGWPVIHGWVYDLKTGLLKELAMVKPGDEIEAEFNYKL
jgi:carbonic anhydrase